MVNIKSKSQARRAVREAQTRANQARVQRERQNVEDTAVLLLAQGRLGGITDWEAERIEQIRAEGQRRRCEHQKKAAEAIVRLQQRGESLQAIAESLFISKNTVKTTTSALYRKLGVNSRQAAVDLAQKAGIV